MAENSAISWTDHTFNPWMGCTKVSPACKNCYAERDFDHRYQKVKWGGNGTRVLTSDANWKNPIKWNRDAMALGIRRRVFCASLADVFEDWDGPIWDHRGLIGHVFNGDGDWGFGPQMHRDEVEPWTVSNARLLTMDDVRSRLFALIDATPNLDWLLLTKRPENIRRMWPATYVPHPMPGYRGPFQTMRVDRRQNAWIGTSVENQEYADKRIPELLKCRDLSPVLFLSCEPLLGKVLLSQCEQDRADWVIAGGESGPGARPSNPEWFRSLRDQCSQLGIPFHFKQWGEWGPESTASPVQINNATYVVCERSERLYWVGKSSAGRTLDGVEHDEFPLRSA